MNPDSRRPGEWDDPNDEAAFVARLTEAAYSVALRQGVKGSFVDLELALWRELRAVVAASSTEPRRAALAGTA